MGRRSLPLEGQAQPQGGHGAAIRTAPVGALPPRTGGHFPKAAGRLLPGTMEFGFMNGLRNDETRQAKTGTGAAPFLNRTTCNQPVIPPRAIGTDPWPRILAELGIFPLKSPLTALDGEGSERLFSAFLFVAEEHLVDAPTAGHPQ